MIAAGLGEGEIAARLGVDPRTVRRWLEGRVPHGQHRWALAMLLRADDADLWPGRRAPWGRNAEVVAVYPRRDLVPAGEWPRLLGSARGQIGVLTRTGLFMARQPGALDVLKEKVITGMRVRICL